MDVNKGSRLHLAVEKGHAMHIAVTVKVVVGRIFHKKPSPQPKLAPIAVFHLIQNIS